MNKEELKKALELAEDEPGHPVNKVFLELYNIFEEANFGNGKVISLINSQLEVAIEALELINEPTDESRGCLQYTANRALLKIQEMTNVIH